MPAELPSSMDNLKQVKGLIDLSGHSDNQFGLEEYTLDFVFDDIVLAEFVDQISDNKGDVIERNGLFVPTNILTKSWRKAEVILVGPNVKYCKKGDIVIFPNDKGVTVANIEIAGYGKIKNGIFLNEQRLFGICSPAKKTEKAEKPKKVKKNKDANKSTVPKEPLTD